MIMPLTTTSPLARARRVVVKVGSALLVDDATGDIRAVWLESLCDDIAALKANGAEVVIVTSGAIALGRTPLGLRGKAMRLEEKQAAAAAGQATLIHAYQDSLARHGIPVAQILLTLGDSEARRRFLNASNTLETLLKLGVVPVVNENDTVATQEIRYGDNDRLAARIAQMVAAEALVLFSLDIDGLYTADPTSDPTAQHIPVVTEIDQTIARMAGKPKGHGSGGMVTKILAAQICMAAGCNMAIAPGRQPHPLKAMLNGGTRCTWFVAADEPVAARKRWIAGSLAPKGTFTVDDGAADALRHGKSLLPAGVTAIEGRFDRGDAVVVKDSHGHELARGLSAYASKDARIIVGHKTQDIEALLGYRGRDEIIHRNDLVLTRNGGNGTGDAREETGS
jgi:glutamate 5-kinase